MGIPDWREGAVISGSAWLGYENIQLHNFVLPPKAHTSMHGDLTAMGQAAACDDCTSTVTCDSPLKRSSTA